MNNDQRTSSMNSFVDAHTPSESPEASSSESSTGGDWESGEFNKTNELNVEHWPKQRTFSNSKQQQQPQPQQSKSMKKLANFNKQQQLQQKQQKQQKQNNNNSNNNNNINNTTVNTAITTSTSSIPAKLSHQHQFKSKSNSIKIFNNTSNLSSSNNVSVNNININNNVHVSKLNSKKLRWLWNMRSDPDFHETFVKTVNIQTPSELISGRQQSNDSLDYYSEICDNQLSVGSPYKSPSDRVVPSLLSDQTTSSKTRSRTNSFNTKRYHNHLYGAHSKHTHASNRRFTLPEHGSGRATSSSSSPAIAAASLSSKFRVNRDGDQLCDLVVAKPIESQCIGFNVANQMSTANTITTTTTTTTNITCYEIVAGKPNNNSMDSDQSKKRIETDAQPLCDQLPKRPKSNDFDEIPPVSASSSSSISTANEQNSIFDFSLSPRKKHSKIMIETDSTDASASNSPIDESPECNQSTRSKVTPFFQLKNDAKSTLPPPRPPPPIRSASTSSATTDCDEVDGIHSAPPIWSDDVNTILSTVATATSTSSDMSGSNDLTTRSSTSSNSTTSSSSSSLTNIKRSRPPFSFREIRKELRSVMRQNRNTSKK